MKKIMDAGYGKTLMLFEYYPYGVYILMPGTREHEGELASYKGGTCRLFDQEKEACTLHAKGLKPLEGKVALHDKGMPRGFYGNLSKTWRSKLAEQVIAEWLEKYADKGVKEKYESR